MTALGLGRFALQTTSGIPCRIERSRELRRVPYVTVVILCYNYGCYLADAICSVLSQESVSVQVVVVDDASTDDSGAIAQGFADADQRVTLIAFDRNQGPVRAFNEGLLAVRGEYLVRLDADDMLTLGALKRAVALMEHHPDVGIVYAHPYHFSGENSQRLAGEREAT